MRETIIEALIASEQPHELAHNLLLQSPSFDKRILDYQDTALSIWWHAYKRFADKEKLFHIPYRLCETPKLYAIDALAVAEPLIKNPVQLHALAEVFTVFYLMVHLFDDHVEHRDKFIAKFNFTPSESSETQRGAAPFSFLLIAEEVIKDILDEQPNLRANDKLALLSKINITLARQTHYFTQERKSDLSTDEILDIKQHKVAGDTLAIVADLIKCFAGEVKLPATLHAGLIYLGSMTQITDDIRDMQVDATLSNANIVIAAQKSQNGMPSLSLISTIYEQEATNALQALQHTYNKKQLSVLLSLPFYPFMIDKDKLRLERPQL